VSSSPEVSPDAVSVTAVRSTEHTLFLLDGMALAYRAHFALATNPIRTSTGRVTSGIYGFTNTLLDLLNRFNPTHLAVVFDTDAPTARHKEFEAYKAQRNAMPEELSQALPDIKRMIRAFNFPVLELDGYEADDLIGTLARKAETAGFTTYMVTPDKDFGQLVSEHILQYRPSRMGDNPETLGVAEVLAKWGIANVDQVRDILGFSGDTSDNIPGVPGVGPKTALKLVAQYGTLENALDHASEQKGKLGESLVKFREQALLSKRLVTIDTAAPIAFEPDQLLIGARDDETLKALFSEFEFNSLGRRLFGEDFKAGRGFAAPASTPAASADAQPAAKRPAFTPPPTPTALPMSPAPVGPLKTIEDTKPDYEIVAEKAAAKWLKEIGAEKIIGLAFDVDAKGILRGLAVSAKTGQARYVAWSEKLMALFAGEAPRLAGHDLKLGVRAWLRYSENQKSASQKIPLFFDTALAHSLVYPDLRHTLEYVAESMLGYTPMAAPAASGQQDFLDALESSSTDEQSTRRAMERADLALQLQAALEPKLKESAQERVFYEIEAPLMPVLAEMENEGIRLDPVALDEVGQKLRAEQARLEASIYAHAGAPFNIGSPKQLGEILFGKLALMKDAKKTKTGQYATDEQTLTALAPLHPIVAEILAHREASKLLSTYISALPASVSPDDGRIHTTFNQLATTTGRLNSQDPNLQNIPIRTAQGREIRRAFIPRDAEHRLLSADYSQIELRILAALTQDPGLMDGLTSGEDIHRATAAKVFGLPLDQVTKDQRNQAKMVNYGISYGISAFGLSQRLGIPRGEAKLLIDGYFAQYPGIRNYMTETVEQARLKGYVETITGRRRYLPDLRSANAAIRAGAERNAINMPIQGSSADLIKIAMVKIAEVARKENWRTKLLLTVHDELVFDLFRKEEARVIEVVRDAMKNALPELKVPILIETGIGAHWLEAH
jgi:DNA polymerase-1